MNICYVVTAGKTLGGSQQSLVNLINSLQGNSINFYVSCHKNWELIEILREKGVEAKIIRARIPVVSRKRHMVFLGFKIFAPLLHFYNFRYINGAIKFLKAKQIDVVHINTTLALDIWAEAAIRCNIPYIYHLREFLTEDHNRDFWDKKYSYRLLTKSYCNIAITKAIRDFWSEKAPNDYRLIYNGLPKDKYYVENKTIFDKETVTLIIVGRITATKGQLDAVKAIAYLLANGVSNVYLKIVGYRGGNPCEKELKKYIDEKGLGKNVKLFDFTYDLAEHRRSCDIGLTASRAEAFGRVTIENMMAGLLAIGTDSGGTPELIENGKTGLLYEYGNYVQLAQLIQYAMSHRDKMREIALEGQRNAIENYTIEKTAQKVKSVYEEIAERKTEKTDKL